MSIAADQQMSLQEQIIQIDYLDHSAKEVFAMMLASEITPTELKLDDSERARALTAVIGLAGEISGAFTLVISETAALRIAALLLGAEAKQLDNEVYDAVGEITNILAGAWKSQVPALHSGCLLSVPTIVSGSSYGVHLKATNFNLMRNYLFAETPITIEIAGEIS